MPAFPDLLHNTGADFNYYCSNTESNMEKHNSFEVHHQTPQEDETMARNNLLAESGFFVSAQIRATSIIEPLPQPGDTRHYSDYQASPPSNSSAEKTVPKPQPKHEKESDDDGDTTFGVILNPADWFKPKNMGNPLNPIYW